MTCKIKTYLVDVDLLGVKIVNVPAVGSKKFSFDEEPAFSGKVLLNVAQMVQDHPHAKELDYQKEVEK